MDSAFSRRACLFLCVGAIPIVSGCTSTAYRAKIQAPYSHDRILAIREAGDRRDQAAIPLLVDRLEDEDSAVRFYAILALERITGERLGYRYSDSALDRQQAVERWREYAAARDGHDAVSRVPISQPAS